MHKMPVGETISGAYSFAFAGFLTVLGTVWLPYAVFVAFCAAAVFLIAPDLPGHIMRGEFGLPVIYSLWRVGGVIWLASIIVRAMVTVGLQERALGRVEGPTFFYFSLGAPVWRMIGAIFLAILAIVLLAILTGCGVALIGYLAVKFVPAVGRALAVIAIIAGVLWFIYAIVRLMFFLPAVVVSEESVGLVRSWELGGGNFWRIFAVLFVVFVPVAIGLHVVQNALIGPFMPGDFSSLFHQDLTPGQFGQAYMSIFKSVMQQMRYALPFLIVFGLIQELLFLGLGNGAVGKAYLAVTKGSAA